MSAHFVFGVFLVHWNSSPGAHFARYGVNNSPYFLNDVECTGDEESIFGCSSMRYPSIRTLECKEFEAVGVLCRNDNLTGK